MVPTTTKDPEAVMTIANTPAELFDAVPFAELATRTLGRVAVPGDADYDALVSPWNVAVPVRPAAVVAAESDQGEPT